MRDDVKELGKKKSAAEALEQQEGDGTLLYYYNVLNGTLPSIAVKWSTLWKSFNCFSLSLKIACHLVKRGKVAQAGNKH